MAGPIIGRVNAANKGMQWNDERTSVSDRWGTTPAMVEIVPATITLEREPEDAVQGQYRLSELREA